jgi:hypothetical protein
MVAPPFFDRSPEERGDFSAARALAMGGERLETQGECWMSFWMLSLGLFNGLPWYGPNRNRWFTELNSMVDLSMANC